MTTSDRYYLNELVALRTGLSPPDAERRVGDAITQMKDAANRARRVGIIAGFMIAATLLIGLAAAWWGASVGCKHRDENTVWHGLARRGHPRALWSKP